MKKETSVIREAASRAVQELPARLESGAAIAQESLEAVGQAIDNVGSTVSDIIGKDLTFASNDGYLDQSDDHNNNNNNVGMSSSREAELNFGANAKPYSRIEAMIRALQCDIRTYIDEVEESGYSDWKMGFRLEEKREEMQGLLDENGAIGEILGEVVPGNVDVETFWCRYFYRVDKVVRGEEARLRMVKRAISGEGEEDLSWDVEDDDGSKGKHEEGERDKGGVGVSGAVDDESLEEKESSEGKLGSDISIISSQRSSHAEDDLGWDEIEDIRSGDESNVGDVRKRLSAAGEDEELSAWDIEDDGETAKL